MNEKLRKQTKQIIARLKPSKAVFTLSVNDLSTPIKVQIGRMDKTKNMIKKYGTYKNLTSNTSLVDKRIGKHTPCKHQSTLRQE